MVAQFVKDNRIRLSKDPDIRAMQEQRRFDFRAAVGGDAMGHFLEQQGPDWMKLEWEARSSYDLIRIVAAKLCECEEAGK